MFKVVYSTGLDCNYTFFVDTKSKKVSEDYFNLLFHNDSEIVFLEDGTIYVADLFVENIRTSIKLDFSKTAVPQSAITCVKLQDNKLHIEYLNGEDYETIIEEIILN